jgi:signal transduction histidine kinase
MKLQSVVGIENGRPQAPAHPGTQPVPASFLQNALLLGVNATTYQQIEPKIEVIHFAPNQVIFEENDPGDSLYLILKGSVKISKRGRGGKQETLAHLTERDFFGEMALIDSGKRSAQASAVGYTILGRVNKESWDFLLHLVPREILTNFTQTVTKRLRQNNQHFIEEVMRSERLSLLGTTVSSIVHDLNNPISTILGACHVIQTSTQDELTAKMAGLIRGSIDRMAAMTGEIIDFSRGETELKLKWFPLSELLSGLEPDFAKCRPRIDVRLEVLFDGRIYADQFRLVRVFSNLIRNAREAMKNEAEHILRFTVKQANSVLRFEVTDTGCGIPADLLPRIFEPFVTHGKTGGTGLGLAISKAAIEAHQGTITVRSGAGGTSFQVDLPLRAEPPKSDV